MKILCIGDVHLSDTPPSIRTDSYTDDVLDKLAFCVNLAQAQGCQLIIQAGDMFHIKTPSRNSHSLVQRTAHVLTSAQIPVLIVPGNHDMTHDRLDSLRKQPLGTLAKVSGIDLLIGPHPEWPVFGIPFLQDWAELPKWMDAFKKSGKPFLATHAPIFPKGEDPIYDYISAPDWASLMGGSGFCLYGHIHDIHGVYNEGGVTFCNQGAISRGSLHEKTLNRDLSVSIWDSETGDFTVHPISFKPPEAVFRLVEKSGGDFREAMVQDFVSKAGSTTLVGINMEEVISYAHSQELSVPARELVTSLIEGVA